MNNDNEKNLNGAENTPDNSANDELDTLADVFQEELNKASQEAAQNGDEAPVIQPLDFDKENDSDDADNESSDKNPADSSVSSKKTKTAGTDEKKKKKKKKKSRTAAVIIPIILCAFVMLFAIYAVFVCVTTDFDEMVGAYINAQNASVETDKLAFYEEALEKCDTEDKSYDSFVEKINEQITLLTLSTKDFVNAYTYYTSASFPEIKEGKAPHFKEFKTYLDECDTIKTVGDKLYSTVLAASDNGAKEPDNTAVCETLGTPAYFTDTCKTIVTSIYSGILASKNESYSDAATAYGEAITTLSGLMGGIKSQELIEQTVIAYFKAGSVKDAVSFNDTNMTEEMKAAPKFTEYTDVLNSIEQVAGYAAGLYASVKAAVDANADADISAIVGALSVSDMVKAPLNEIAENIAAGYKATKEENNITGVYRYLGLASSSILELGAVPDTEMLTILADAAFSYGSFEDANSIAKDYFTADTLSNYAAITEVYDSFYAAYEVWYNAYANAYYNGGAFDFDSVAASLDALITDTATDSLVAFVNFVKYYTYYSALQAEPTAEDYSVMLGYLQAAKEKYPDYTLFFNQYIISILDETDDFEAAVSVSRESLGIDAGSDIANAHIAEQARRNGDIDASLAAALAGTEKCSSNIESARQAVIAYILKNDFENAYSTLKTCWDANTLGYEMVVIFNALYNGDNAEIVNFLENSVKTVEEYSTANSFTYSDSTIAIVNGTKTAADIFAAGDFDIS